MAGVWLVGLYLNFDLVCIIGLFVETAHVLVGKDCALYNYKTKTIVYAFLTPQLVCCLHLGEGKQCDTNVLHIILVSYHEYKSNVHIRPSTHAK